MCERQHTVRNHRSKSQVNLQELFSGKTQLRQPFHGLFCYFTLQLVTLMMLIFQAVKCQQGKQAYILYTVNGFLFFIHVSAVYRTKKKKNEIQKNKRGRGISASHLQCKIHGLNFRSLLCFNSHICCFIIHCVGSLSV